MSLDALTQLTLEDDLKELIPSLIAPHVVQVNGFPHYDIVYQDRDKCPPGDKPCIFFNNLETPIGTAIDTKTYTRPCTFNIGLKYPINGVNEGTVINPGEMLGNILEIFNRYAYENKYDVAYKGTTYTNVNAASFGIVNPSIGSIIEYIDKDCGCVTKELIIQFEVHFAIRSLAF